MIPFKSVLCFGIVVIVAMQFSTCRAQQVETNDELLAIQSIQALLKGISYFNKINKRVTADELLALRIAKEALLTTVENCIKSPALHVPESILEDLKLLCARLNVIIPRALNIYTANVTQGFKNYISSKWPGFLPYKSIKVDKNSRKSLETMDHILPLDLQLCLGDLTHIENCFLSKSCIKVIEPKMAPESGIAYQATILSTLQALGCSSKVNDKWKKVTVDDLTDDICYTLYPKVSTFHASYVFQEDEVLSFLDAFFVCSLLGFDDFLQVTHQRLSAILEWQLSTGCFGATATTERGRKCLPGMTSAAIAQLGLYVKWLLDPKGFAMSSGKQPFKKPMWVTFIVKIILIFVALVPLFIRKIRRMLLGMVGRLLSFIQIQIAKFIF